MYKCNRLISVSGVFGRGKNVQFVRELALDKGCIPGSISLGSASSDYLSFEGLFPDQDSAGVFREELASSGIQVH